MKLRVKWKRNWLAILNIYVCMNVCIWERVSKGKQRVNKGYIGTTYLVLKYLLREITRQMERELFGDP